MTKKQGKPLAQEKAVMKTVESGWRELGAAIKRPLLKAKESAAEELRQAEGRYHAASRADEAEKAVIRRTIKKPVLCGVCGDKATTKFNGADLCARHSVNWTEAAALEQAKADTKETK